MSRWIWKFGEFEFYYNKLVHFRRQHYGHIEPPTWKIYPVEPVVMFEKVVSTQGGVFTIHAQGDYATEIMPYPQQVKQGRIQVYIKWGASPQVTLDPGTYDIQIRVQNADTFPAIYVDGIVESDQSWLASDMAEKPAKVGSSPYYTDPDRKPEVFPFSYQDIQPVSVEKAEGGLVYDYGKETFAAVTLSGLKDAEYTLRYGESKEEALDPVDCVIRFTRKNTDGQASFIPYAFRYLFISDTGAKIHASYEYLEEEAKGTFHCNEPLIDQVYDTAVYTFQLNSREFLLDGIKRDRWVWSADAYQSFFVNHYLFFDKELEKRTLIALGGKKPFLAHINTIVDYTFFWIISLYEYYRCYKDLDFLDSMFAQLEEVMDFCLNRLDPDGYARRRKEDWVFIDWAPMDKTGALLGEQVLLAKSMECYAVIADALGKDNKGLQDRCDQLRKKIMADFYDPEQGVFIDSYESGKKVVTRQNNIVAYLYMPLDRKIQKSIYENVVCNDNVPQITTPYFKFYENQVVCREGDSSQLEEALRSYYGAMLKTGATTLYEQFDPNESGLQHYAMYGRRYEKSLCHCWSTSPIYLLGAYRMGVINTGIAYSTFEVKPNLGDLKWFKGTVPVPGGIVSVEADEKGVKVRSDIEGGTLVIGDRRIPLQAGQETRAAWQ